MEWFLYIELYLLCIISYTVLIRAQTCTFYYFSKWVDEGMEQKQYSALSKNHKIRRLGTELEIIFLKCIDKVG